MITGESVEDIAKSTAYVGYDRCLAGGDIVVLKHNQDPKYLSYALSTADAKRQKSAGRVKSKVVHSNVPAISSIVVPVPPIEVQREIVRVLDSFAERLAELANALTVERTYRQEQYQYYLDSVYARASGDRVPLSTLGTIMRGKRFVHADATEDGVPCIHYGELYTYYGVHASEARSHIREELRPKMRYASKNDVIIVGAGENREDIGVGVAWEGDYDVAVHDACYVLRHEQVPKYISYFLRSTDYHNQLRRYVSEGKICSFSGESLGKMIIPLPSIEEQQRIADQLDRFDAICNDLTSGLSNEIAARQKQYEYYREKLLTFKPAM